MTSPPRSVDVRRHILEALEADFVGPFTRVPGESWSLAPEVLPRPPSRWYLTGFLAPQEGREQEEDPTVEDELATGDDQEDEEAAPTEPGSKRTHRMPASMGLTVLLPPGKGDVLRVTVRYADYVRHEPKRGPDGKRVRGSEPTWERVPRQPPALELPLDPEVLKKGVEVEGSRNLRVMGHLAPANAPGLLPPETRVVSIFVVNGRQTGERGRQDEQSVFQVQLEVSHSGGLYPRPNRRDHASEDPDAAASDLQFRDRMEYSVGHGVSVEVIHPPEGPVTTARTTWIPRHEVPRVITHEVPAVKTAMEDLAVLPDGTAARTALAPLLDAYGVWLTEQRRLELDSADRASERDLLLGQAAHARERMAEGLKLLAQNEDVLTAFKLANEAMARAAYKRNAGRYQEGKRPEWRLFQLAFLLLNLPGLVDGGHKDRRVVELIFFPTGGGKTEAYLGVIAFTLVLRRLRGARHAHGGLGLAVLLRYTLRLLTLDQLGRAASLICALEMLRKEDPERLGTVRFSIGLWVGRSATANTFTEVAKRITDYKNNPSENASSPFPLSECPWCMKPLTRDSLALVPNKTNPTDVVVGCADFRCEFSAGKNPGEGLPVLFVDEQVYRELPGFLVATVDKFALLPWRGETGMLFGRVFAREGRRFYGPMEPGTLPLAATRLPEGVLPPELIVQDELHLISGPLGSMVGLYETAIDVLCSRPLAGGRVLRPKVLASTATVRRAREQVQALFGRDELALFPPPGPNDSETFFAKVDRASPGRLYLGVAAPGRSMKAVLLRSYIALLGAAWKARGGKAEHAETADPYLTLAGYFNSLRELGGMRRLVEDEVRTRLTSLAERRPLDTPENPWFANRVIEPHPVELTSRESTASIARSKAQLARKHGQKGAVDVLLASNMISVGVDIDRLGVMAIAGQPKTTSEYIQASSRVGRDANRPGIVLTVLNLHKPRDRSHYERFGAYHDCFYRFVEATSVTPFSAPALERGLAALLIAMTRLSIPEMTPPRAVMELQRHRASAEEAARQVAARAGGSRGGMSEQARQELEANLVSRGRNLLDAWERVMATSRDEAGGVRSYSPWDREKPGKPLLLTRLQMEEDRTLSSDEQKFVAPSSMRDVEPTVHLWVERSGLGGRRQGHGW